MSKQKVQYDPPGQCSFLVTGECAVDVFGDCDWFENSGECFGGKHPEIQEENENEEM